MHRGVASPPSSTRLLSVLLLCGALLCAAMSSALAQSPSPPAASQKPSPAPAASGMQITLGRSTAELSGPWRFHTGDNPAWSSPDLDDSSWETVDLTPPPGTADADLGTSGFLPGWTDLGHADYTGYAWYRLRVNLGGSYPTLALKMPGVFDDAYQVFVNGRQIGQFGRFRAQGVTTFSALPRGFRLPADLTSGTITIAIRMWMASSTPFSSPDAGGLHAPPVLGRGPAIATQVRLDWDDIAHDVGIGFLEALILLLALAVSLTHFWMDRTDKAYLWLALVTLVTFLGNAIVLLVNFTTAIPQDVEVLLTDVVIAPLRIGLWVLFWAYWFQVGPARWLQRAVWGLVAALAIMQLLLRPPLFGEHVPVAAAGYLVPLMLTVKLALAALLVVVTWQGIRRRRSEGWLALPAVLLAAAANYQHELSLVHIPIATSVFGFAVSLGTASTMVSLLLITLMLSRRFLASQRLKVQWQLELAQAREVQQLMLPKRAPGLDQFAIESEYRPAREVGGDFFQILPDDTEGSLLLLVGDVTGKGLCAGMMVAFILGVIQTAMQSSREPAEILSILNRRLCERDHATATCLAMRITADGEVTVANAGHLAPYLDDRELPLEGALPLGILEGIDYPTVRFPLPVGAALTLMSDGVVEAQNDHGELFGFDRVERMMQQPISAATLAEAAQRFGQEDDILVLRVERRLRSVAPLPQAALAEV